MKAFITGIGGFVGGYLGELLLAEGMEVYGCDLMIENVVSPDFITEQVDITDFERVSEVIGKSNPDYIFHLAGLGSVSLSFKKPELTKTINVGGTRNLLDALDKISSSAKIVVVSSGEVYKTSQQPLPEISDLDGSLSPYAESRIEQEELCKQYDRLSICISRSFNHIGPRQAPQFVASSFAQQVSLVMAGKQEPVIRVGNLSVTKDFSDVRDMVRAYILLAQKGKVGEAYNLGSGRGVTIQKILDELISLSGHEISVEVDPDRYRASDNPVLISDNSKFSQQTGWKPEFTLEKTLSDMLEYWCHI